MLFRIRGGMFPTGSTFAARLIFAAGMSMVAMVGSLDWRTVIVAPGAFAACLLPWFSGIDMGRNEGAWWRDALVMTARGFGWSVPMAAPLYFVGYPQMWVLAVAGGLCAVCYEIGWRLPTLNKDVPQGTGWGEVLFGAVLGGSLAFGVYS